MRYVTVETMRGDRFRFQGPKFTSAKALSRADRGYLFQGADFFVVKQTDNDGTRIWTFPMRNVAFVKEERP